jgi:DNA-binding Xre family transcriptional regulator
MKKLFCYTVSSRRTEKRHWKICGWRRNERLYTGVAMNKNKYRGSNFDDFLKEEGILEEVELKAAKRAVALQLEKLMKSQSLSKKAMAGRMRTSRAAVDRLLDTSNPSVTLSTLGKAARVLGRKLKIELVAA